MIKFKAKIKTSESFRSRTPFFKSSSFFSGNLKDKAWRLTSKFYCIQCLGEEEKKYWEKKTFNTKKK